LSRSQQGDSISEKRIYQMPPKTSSATSTSASTASTQLDSLSQQQAAQDAELEAKTMKSNMEAARHAAAMQMIANLKS
jgi:hypothetical protein